MSDQPQEDEQPYIVTRGKPPREHMFKPGQSGNPKGRPKDSKDFLTLVEEEFDRKIDVNLAGRRTKLTKRQVMARRFVDSAMKCEQKTIATYLSMQKAKRGAGKDSTAEIVAEDMAAFLDEDEQILQAWLARSGREEGRDAPLP